MLGIRPFGSVRLYSALFGYGERPIRAATLQLSFTAVIGGILVSRPRFPTTLYPEEILMPLRPPAEDCRP